MTFNSHTVNPYIRVAMQSVLAAGSEIKRRVIFDYEMIYIEDGEFTLNYNERDYKCKNGQFILLRPGVPHSFKGINNDLSQPHIHFDMTYSSKSAMTPVCFKDICDLTPEEHELLQRDVFEEYPKVPFVSFSDKQTALKLFYSIVGEAQESELVRKSKLMKIIDMLIFDNFPNCFAKEESSYNIARQLKDYIDAGHGLSAQLSDFEKQFSYSKYHLERQFKKHYGISIVAYRNNKRMELAKELLKTKTVSFVSEKLGFSSIYVFSRTFKQYYGISPSRISE